MGQDARSCLGPLRSDIVRQIDGSEVLLQSGRRLVLADVRIPDASLSGQRRAAERRLAALVGRDVLVSSAGEADRWGRENAALRPAEPGGDDVAEDLLGDGLAVIDPGERDGLCRPDLRWAEGPARQERAGLWESWPIAATDAEALRRHAGQFVVVMGRIVSVGERPDRTYLNFGRDYGHDLAVTIPRRSWARFKSAGLGAADLTGRTVLVRGTIEMRRAPSIEIVSPDVLERLAP